MAGEVEFLSGLRPHGIGCVTGPVGNRSEGEARGIVVECLREVALVAKRHGLQLGIEPIHPSIAAEFSFISSVEDAVSLIEAAGCDNVGLIFDIWHLYGQPHLAADIERYVDMFTLVDVGDWREPTRSWCDRLLPGDGAASVASTLRALREAGYQGWYELEILSDDGTYGNDFPDSLWKWDTNQLLREGFERFMRCWRGVT
jgi:sugar phosphate isomerase/epimerase